MKNLFQQSNSALELWVHILFIYELMLCIVCCVILCIFIYFFKHGTQLAWVLASQRQKSQTFHWEIPWKQLFGSWHTLQGVSKRNELQSLSQAHVYLCAAAAAGLCAFDHIKAFLSKWNCSLSNLLYHSLCSLQFAAAQETQHFWRKRKLCNC